MAEGGNKNVKLEAKSALMAKCERLIQAFPKILLCNADNVGSSQMATIRVALRGKAEILMGKKTMIRKVVRNLAVSNPKLEKLLPHLVGNRGLVLTKEDPSDVRAVLNKTTVGAPAKAGSIAPVDVIVPPGLTGMEPNHTSFFQALSIPTKISKGQIEILTPQHLVSKGAKVTQSQAVLLQKLKINPFSYGLNVEVVYDDGTVYGAEVLDLTPADVVAKFVSASRDIAAISLQIGYPTLVSAPHSIINAFKNILHISIATDYTIKQAAQIKDIIANPEKFAAAAPAAAAPAASSGGAKAKEPEPEPEEEGDMGFGLFD
eukprot:GILI01019953.1.p2 GENE.GILI01019953.1~~GILI01019953.1.p2  ORF type:complete len:336 (-),score=128.78 GILI01019953.1:79-1032(-)